MELVAYGRCKDVSIDIGENLTVVVGTNEAGKSTALDALTDLLWGIPTQSARASDVVRSQLR
ncbi:MAG: AAA family ATPase, partial [Dehalococcoidia bacterium]